MVFNRLGPSDPISSSLFLLGSLRARHEPSTKQQKRCEIFSFGGVLMPSKVSGYGQGCPEVNSQEFEKQSFSSVQAGHETVQTTSQRQSDWLEASSTSVHPSQHYLAGPRDRLPKSCPAIPKIGDQPVVHSGQAVEPKRFGTSLFSTRAGDKQSFRAPISFGASQPVLLYA
jgi:hypothetical protein